MHLDVEGSTNIRETHIYETHTPAQKGAGACDVATDVISTHSFPRWQNVKTDSGAGR